MQDLHGYDHPWPGGGGKNLLPMTLANIKAKNISGTWSENSYVINGVTFNCFVADDGSVTKIIASGTASADAILVLGSYNFLAETYYALNGCPTGGGGTTYRIYAGAAGSAGYDDGDGAQFKYDADGSHAINIRVYNGYTASNLTFYPMLRLATETDPTFEPYSNICPITGRTGVEVTRTGKNLLPSGTTVTNRNRTFTVNDDGSVTVTGNGDGDNSAAFDIEVPTSLYGKSVVLNGCPSGGNNSTTYRMFFLVDNSRTATDTGSGAAYDIPSSPTTCIVRINVFAAYTISGSLKFSPMIRLATETDPTFETYTGSIYPITFPSDAGTVYGGELTVNRDGTGELVVDKGIATVSNFAGSALDSANGLYYSDYTPGNAVGTLVGVYNSHYKILAGDPAWNSAFESATVNTSGRLRVYHVETTLASWQSAKADMQFIYVLTSPITYTLTTEQVRTLLELNHVWASDGDITQLTYHLDKPVNYDIQDLYDSMEAVKNLVSFTESMIADTDTVTATTNYSIGDVLIVNHTLMRATAAIATGETITEGTNVERVNVATMINELKGE